MEISLSPMSTGSWVVQGGEVALLHKLFLETQAPSILLCYYNL